MALSKALNFVTEAIKNEQLRALCSKLTKEELLLQLNFNEVEFEDAINMGLVKCQTYEQAEAYQQLRIWFLLI
ncbi:hypothetical protein ACFQ5N_13195 [Lutibacter holmesii]|uniref:Nif11 family protein n=1 Tax=Lutibacter holmesii TaxID=1137985 RepID=A0ABW3WT86_9FLAO